jgi:hypothetical protein
MPAAAWIAARRLPGALDGRILPNRRLTNLLPKKGGFCDVPALSDHELPVDISPTVGSAPAAATLFRAPGPEHTHLIRVALTLALRPAKEISWPPKTLREMVTVSFALKTSAESA